MYLYKRSSLHTYTYNNVYLLYVYCSVCIKKNCFVRCVPRAARFYIHSFSFGIFHSLLFFQSSPLIFFFCSYFFRCQCILLVCSCAPMTMTIYISHDYKWTIYVFSDVTFRPICTCTVHQCILLLFHRHPSQLVQSKYDATSKDLLVISLSLCMYFYVSMSNVYTK